jgi:hypothetical protein
MNKTLSWFLGLTLALSLTLVLLTFQPSSAGPSQGKPGGDAKGAAAKCVKIAGALLARQKDQAWHGVKAGDTLAAGILVVALPEAEIHSPNEAVKVRLMADIGKRGPFPVMEAAVIFHDSPGFDLDVTLDRGIMGLTNLKKKGSAKVQVRFADQKWQITLKEPGTRVGLERYGRHPAGLPEVIDAKLDNPITSVALIVLEGECFVDTGEEGYGLRAPPGPALAIWDNADNKVEVQPLKKLDLPKPDDKETKLFKEICDSTHDLGEGKPGPVLDKLLHSDKKVDRVVGVTVAGALDDLPRLIDALADPKHADARDRAVLVLRHWMGREPGQVKKLYTALTEEKKYSKVHARIILELLFGFSEKDRASPTTYQTLIGFLRHSQLPVRELAAWHLFRLAPAGRDIAYDAGGTEAQRQKAYDQWRALVPEGKLPPQPKSPPG